MDVVERLGYFILSQREVREPAHAHLVGQRRIGVYTQMTQRIGRHPWSAAICSKDEKPGRDTVVHTLAEDSDRPLELDHLREELPSTRVRSADCREGDAGGWSCL